MADHQSVGSVLDGYVAMAFGIKRTDISEGKAPRWNRIARMVDAVAAVRCAAAGPGVTVKFRYPLD